MLVLENKGGWRRMAGIALAVGIGCLVFAAPAKDAFAAAPMEELPDYAVVDLATDYSDPIVDGDVATCDITNNHQDTLYSKLLGARASDFTPPRLKTDYTSSYMYYKYVGGAATAEVWASDGSNYYPAPPFSGARNIYYPQAGTAFYMYNYVKERGYSYAAIHIDRSNASNPDGTSRVEFLWSPDSV